MASAADGKVVIDTQLNNKGFTKGISGLKSKMGGLTSVVGKLGGALASAFAVKQLINFGKECIELGSNVSEVQNVVDTAFGDMSYKVEAFAETAIQNFGMSRLAAKKTASTYMAMAKGMGLADEAASDMAISLAGLTGDVASFYNISQEAADVKLKSVFTGESESLKELGVVMTQTNLKAYALEQGITKDLTAMSQAELVALRYGYVMKSLALANGDFAKTSDSWANQTRILSMQWQEFMSIIGQALITVLTPAVKVLNQIVSALINMATVVNSVINELFGVEQQTAAAVSSEINGSVEAQEDLTAATEDTAKAQKNLLAGFDEINQLGGESEASGSSGDTVSAGIDTAGITAFATTAQKVENSGLPDFFGRLADAVEPFVKAFSDAKDKVMEGASWIGDTLTQVWNDISSLASPLTDWFNGDFTSYLQQYIYTVGNIVGGLLDSVGMIFTDLWNIVVFPSLQQWAVDILPAMTQFKEQFLITFDTLFNEVKGIFDRIWQEAVAPALERVQQIWSDVWDTIVNVWQEYGEPIFEKVREAISNTAGIFHTFWESTIKPIWDNFMAVVDKLWTEHLKPLWDNFVEFVAMLVDGALEIYNKFIAPIINWLVAYFGPKIAGVVNFVVNTIGRIIGFVADTASNIITSLKGVINFLVGIFTGDWEKAWAGVKGIFAGIWNQIATILESGINGIIRGINWLITQLNKIRVTMPDWVPGIGGRSIGINIPYISEVKLPRLAEGAVIPPNREFLAVLGDQKRGNNIEAPEDLIRKIVREESGGGTSDYLLREILEAIREGKVLMVGKKQLGQVVTEALSDRQRSAGTSILATR